MRRKYKDETWKDWARRNEPDLTMLVFVLIILLLFWIASVMIGSIPL